MFALTVRTAQFDIILGKPPVIIIKMRANTRSPESMPRVNPHLKTRTTDMSFAQNNTKFSSLGTCLPHAQDQAHIPFTKGTLPKNIESNFKHKAVQ